MSAADPRIRRLKIQTGVVKRCGKEKVSYRKEADMQKEKVEKMKAAGGEESEIKIRKMNEVVQESLMMIPDCHRRLEKAIADLQNLIEELEPDFGNLEKDGEASSPGRQEMKDAKKALNDSEEHLKVE
jgi:tubulin-specific chaperone A